MCEDHVITIGVDRARLGSGNRQTIGDIIAVTRGKLQRGITREGQARRGSQGIGAGNLERTLSKLEASREEVGRSERERAITGLGEVTRTIEGSGKGHVIAIGINHGRLANGSDQRRRHIRRNTRGILEGRVTREGERGRRTENQAIHHAGEGRLLGHS